MRFEELNPKFLKDNYLFGIPLQDMEGNPMKEELLEHYLKAAVQYTQRILQIVIQPTEIKNEIHDYYANDVNNWTFFQLNKRPILDVESLTLNYGGREMFQIPKEWIQHPDNSGQIQLFPTSGSAGGLILTSGASFIPLLSGSYQYAPAMWKISYRAGIEDIPDDLAEFIMKRASIGVLQVWGDLIIGAGIANQTISIDGLSQSIGTTQSPEFSGAGARIKNYMDDLKVLEKTLQDTYLGINMTII